MRVFVTGATGYIGSAVVRELVRRKHDVHALARTPEAQRKLDGIGAHPVAGGLDDLALLREAATHADITIHTAFEQSADGVTKERAALGAMLDGTAGGHGFIYTSGVWVYGNRGDAVVGEDAPLAPLELVAWRPAHEDLAFTARTRDVRATVVRPGIVYGDGGGIIGGMVADARAGKTIRVVGDGANRWSCVRIDALAELYARIVEHPNPSSIYNATRGAAIPYVEIARAASRSGGGNGAVEHVSLDDAHAAMGAFADALASDCQISSERAERELGWAPHRPTVLEELSNTVVI